MARALHVGHLIPLMVLLGSCCTFRCIGCATALVGDPSGCTKVERTPVDPSVTGGNIHRLTERLTEHATSILHNVFQYAKTRQPVTPGMSPATPGQEQPQLAAEHRAT
ncbi:hypothetical protein FIBSPDRAFT_903067 [Athelia psychrophila]|uniref:Secreted protein n=1 Tax=Athelia psychrophila TaxID=1759441 RepID=A0A167WFG1_9AGAM|nr:hypothetical protein FIBSPDRAFT_903067 [Fibularhizoctonia sp. CBS 109695]